MRNLIILTVLMIGITFLSCYNENATQASNQYNLASILSDSNWVEVTDTIPINLRCIDYELIKMGAIVQSENDYKQLWQKSINSKTMPKDSLYNPNGDCTIYYPTEIDYNNRSLVGFSIFTGFANCYRRIFVNYNTKEYLYLLEIEHIRDGYIGKAYLSWTSLPKIQSDYKISFDTTYKR